MALEFIDRLRFITHLLKKTIVRRAMLMFIFTVEIGVLQLGNYIT